MRGLRIPVVAGHFYPSDKNDLERLLKTLFSSKAKETKKKRIVKGLILPHAGYMYSGAVAAEAIAISRLSPTIILMGPNHTGLGASFSVMTKGQWRTPLGDVPIDEVFAKQLVAISHYFEDDRLAHLQEHSLEVMLPFLQRTMTYFQIVPIVISSSSAEVYYELAEDIIATARMLKKEGEISVIASSDMTHYEPHEQAKKKDSYAIEAILKLDERLLLKRVTEKNITMCGIAPVCVGLPVLKKLKAKKAELIRYQTSGDVNGNYSSVVGYASICVY